MITKFMPAALRKLLIPLTLSSLLVACSGGGGGGGGVSGTAPLLSSMTIEPESAAAGLTIPLSGSFSFSDPDGDLDGGSMNYTYEGTTYSLTLPAELDGITDATVTFSLFVVLSSNTGTMDIPFWLEDSAGHSSNIIHGSFTQLWTRQFGTSQEDIGNEVIVDNSGNVLVTGTTYGDLDGQTNLGASDVFITKYASDTTPAWTRLIGSDSADNGRGVAVDGNNNIYVTGDTIGTSFDGQFPSGPQCGFLTKYSTDGSRVWTRLIDSGTGTEAYAVTTDTSNNIYVTGRTLGDLDGETNAGSYDAFLVKFDADGNRLWTRLLGTTSAETAYSVAVDSGGNIYLTGGTDGVLGVDPSPGDPVINSDIFVVKFNQTGTQQWVTQLGTSCAEWGIDIAIDATGGVSVVGKIYTCAFAGNSASGMYDAFLARLDSNGSSQWIRQFGTSNHDSANGVAIDSLGNAYITGYLDSVYFNDDNEGDVIFLAKYDAVGSQTWIAQDNAGYNWGNQGLSVTIDSTDNVYLTGTVQGQLDGHTNSNYGEDEVFILKYDATGIRR